jgi:DNA-directed RNA polymerase subunit RPC12/RpoP
VRLITEDHTLSAMYYCLECGERMSHVKRGHIASLDCPQCRGQLNPVEEALWDGVNPN